MCIGCVMDVLTSDTGMGVIRTHTVVTQVENDLVYGFSHIRRSNLFWSTTRSVGVQKKM